MMIGDAEDNEYVTIGTYMHTFTFGGNEVMPYLKFQVPFIKQADINVSWSKRISLVWNM